MEEDAGGAFELHWFRSDATIENLTHDAPSRNQPTAGPDPDPGDRADRRLRPVPGEADRRRHGRRVRDDLQGRARHARRRDPRARARATGAGARSRSSRSATTGTAGRSRSTARAAGSSRSRPGRTGSPRGRTSFGARSTPGEPDLAGELAEGAALLGRTSVTADEGLAAPAGDRHGEVRSQPARGRRRPGARTVRLVVRAVPALVGRLPRRREGAAAGGGARLRRRLPAAGPPDRRHEPQGPEQRGRSLRRTTSGRRGRSARRTAATTRSTRSSARWADFDAMVAAAKAVGIEIALDFAIQCSPDHPWLKRASRVVQPSSRRHAEVRGEPAEEVPGHLQRQLRVRGLAWPLAGAARRRAATGSTAASPSSASTTRTRSRPRSGSG